jgi:hypothetical protein
LIDEVLSLQSLLLLEEEEEEEEEEEIVAFVFTQQVRLDGKRNRGSYFHESLWV